jgi:hypothetical protein
MPLVRTSRRGWRYTLPPPELQPYNEAGIPWDTPHRSAVFTAHLIAESQGFKPGDSKTKEQVHETFCWYHRVWGLIAIKWWVNSLYVYFVISSSLGK